MTLCSYFLVFLYRLKSTMLGRKIRQKMICLIGNVYFSFDNVVSGVQFSCLKDE